MPNRRPRTGNRPTNLTCVRCPGALMAHNAGGPRPITFSAGSAGRRPRPCCPPARSAAGRPRSCSRTGASTATAGAGSSSAAAFGSTGAGRVGSRPAPCSCANRPTMPASATRREPSSAGRSSTPCSAPDVELVSVPGVLSGRAAVEAESSRLCGADVAFRKAICCDGRGRLDGLVGYRFLSFDDAVRVFEDLHPTVAPFPPVGDRRGRRVRGDQPVPRPAPRAGRRVPARRVVRGGPAGGERRPDLPDGDRGRADVVQHPPGGPAGPARRAAGISTNTGSVSTSDWTVVPEAAVRVGYQVNDRLRVYAGYSALYWPGVYRAAGQIDAAVNPGLLPPPVVPAPGPARPQVPGRDERAVGPVRVGRGGSPVLRQAVSAGPGRQTRCPA